MRILVTGGAGFLGSSLCKRLLNEGNNVICADNFYTGRFENISNLMNNSQFELFPCDIIEKLKFSGKIDEIYNLACPASPIHYQLEPIKTIKTCVLGVINVLELALEHGSKVFQASTSEVYGNPLEHPQKETYWGNINPISRRACYDEGKRAAECIMMDYHRQKGVEIRIARIFNTYGYNMAPNDGRVVSNFILQALKNEDITIYGDGQYTRSFCYVDDTINGIMKLMASDYTQPMNIGNPNEITMEDLAKIIIHLIESKSKIVYKEFVDSDPEKRKPDITLAKNVINWFPKVQLVDGLCKTINYFKKV